MLDADHFKIVNDTYGHPTGDDVLREISARCRKTLRANDILGRYGGEEFVIVFPETNVEEAGAVAERLRAAVAANPIQVGEHALDVTVSIGVAAYSPGHNVERMVERADAALYTAKQDGRNRVRA
jgi:two-component system cell cycle response regulator